MKATTRAFIFHKESIKLNRRLITVSRCEIKLPIRDRQFDSQRFLKLPIGYDRETSRRFIASSNRRTMTEARLPTRPRPPTRGSSTPSSQGSVFFLSVSQIEMGSENASRSKTRTFKARKLIKFQNQARTIQKNIEPCLQKILGRVNIHF